MKFLIFSILLLGLSVNLSTQASAHKNEIASIMLPLNSYLSGHIKGDSKILGQALHYEGKLSYLHAGQYSQLLFDDYLSRMKLRNGDDGVQRIPYIKSIDITHDMAIAKLVLDYSSRIFTDYMTLLKIDNQWKIVNKIAYSVTDPNNNKPLNTDLTPLLASIEHYLTAYIAADIQHLTKSFHPDAKVMNVTSGHYKAQSLQSFIVDLGHFVTKGKGKITTKIQSVDATGNVAISKVQLISAQITHTHYLALLNIAGEWKIVNDTWHVEY